MLVVASLLFAVLQTEGCARCPPCPNKGCWKPGPEGPVWIDNACGLAIKVINSNKSRGSQTEHSPATSNAPVTADARESASR